MSKEDAIEALEQIYFAVNPLSEQERKILAIRYEKLLAYLEDIE